tara:strand:- start:324 stop:623 length:300 start_codon:yes stop_codon:yes gene_type:complete
MGKINKAIIVDYNFYWNGFVSISKLRSDIDELEKMGATRIDIEVNESYGSYCLEIEASYIRIETDEEYEIRINISQRRKEKFKEKELSELKRLKLLYPE